jgi:hypothetical protein
MKFQTELSSIEIKETFIVNFDGTEVKFNSLFRAFNWLDDKSPADAIEMIEKIFKVESKGQTLATIGANSLSTGNFGSKLIVDIYDAESDCSNCEFFNSTRDFMNAVLLRSDYFELFEFYSLNLKA